MILLPLLLLPLEIENWLPSFWAASCPLQGGIVVADTEPEARYPSSRSLYVREVKLISSVNNLINQSEPTLDQAKISKFKIASFWTFTWYCRK